MRWVLAICTVCAVVGTQVPTAHAGDCSGTPPDAVMTLPQPLSKWGTLVCTPYGHIISNHEGWIWSNEGAYSPVFIPSQMMRDNPLPVGNKSYFTRINLVKVDGPEFQTAYSAFHGNFAPDKTLPTGYRLDLESVSGRTLKLYFFDYETHAWGIWCTTGVCDPGSRFMLIDMSHPAK